MGIKKSDLLARQSWQLLHWALNTSGDSCICNPCFGFFQVFEVLELKFWLHIPFSCLFWKPCWKPHKLLWTFTLSSSQRPFMVQRGNFKQEKCFVSPGACFSLMLCRIAWSGLWWVFRCFRMWLVDFSLIGFSVHACFIKVSFPFRWV